MSLHPHPGPGGYPPPPCPGAPVGAVIAFAGQVATLGTASPPGTEEPFITQPIEAWGWTVCDGRSLPIADYPELYAVLGKLYGGDDEHFCLPDYRGTFLRGVDGGAHKDPDAAARTPAPGGDTGIGSRQADAIQAHDHIYGSEPASMAPGSGGDAAGAQSSTPTLTSSGPTDSLQPPGKVRVSQETRPCNVYVHYLIKFTYGPYWPAFSL